MGIPKHWFDKVRGTLEDTRYDLKRLAEEISMTHDSHASELDEEQEEAYWEIRELVVEARETLQDALDRVEDLPTRDR